MTLHETIYAIGELCRKTFGEESETPEFVDGELTELLEKIEELERRVNRLEDQS